MQFERCLIQIYPSVIWTSTGRFRGGSPAWSRLQTGSDPTRGGSPTNRRRIEIENYWTNAEERAERAVVEAGLAQSSPVQHSFRTLFPSFTPKPMQAAVDEYRGTDPFLLIVEDSTGSGKTESALAASGDSFYIGLPTQATANGLWERVVNIPAFRGHRSLIHANSWLVPDAMTYATEWLNDSSRRQFLGQIGVGTIDQAELAVLYTRFSTLRLIGLAGKTLVVDEVHGYDEYQKQVILTLIELQARVGSSVVLLSATLPLSHRKKYAEAWARGRSRARPRLIETTFPLLTRVGDEGVVELPTEPGEPRSVRVEECRDSGSIQEWIRSAVREGRCVCWIRNTVDDAIAASEELLNAGLDVDLFHARFTAAHRAKIEKRIVSRFGKFSQPGDRHGQVLVATQVVEQSLDLDFDLMVSDLAPIDLLIQRAGRLHRHDRGDRGNPVLVLNAPAWTPHPEEDWVTSWNSGTAFVYPDHGRLWRTMMLLREHGMKLPEGTRLLIEGVYGRDSIEIPEGLAGSTKRARTMDIKDSAIASHNTISTTGAYEHDGRPPWDEERAPTRLGEEPTQEWVLTADGTPICETNAESLIRLRESALKDVRDGDGRVRVQVAPWQRELPLQICGADCWFTTGSKGSGSPIEVRYNATQGLRFVDK